MMTLMMQTLIGVTILLVASLLLYFGLRSCKTGASLRHGLLATVLGGTLILPLVMPLVPMRLNVRTAERQETQRQETVTVVTPLQTPEFTPPRTDEYMPPTIMVSREAEETAPVQVEKENEETVVVENENIVETVVGEKAGLSVTLLPAVNVDTVPQVARSTASRAALWMAWSLGTIFFLLRFARSVVVSRRILDKTMSVDDPEFVTLLKRFGLRNVALRRSEVGMVPFTQGVLRPVVVLPETADRWTGEERRAVLTHELAHVKRRDVLGQMFAELCRAVYWFHPLVWLAVRQIRIEREIACDDLVVSAGENPPVYASVLLRIAADLKSVPRRNVVLGCSVAMARRHEVKGRIAAILNPNRIRKPLGKLGSIGMVLSVCAGVTLAAMLTPGEEKTKDGTPTVDASNVVDVSEPSENIVIEVFNTAGKPISGAKLNLLTSDSSPKSEEFVASTEGCITLPYTRYFSPRSDAAFLVTAPGYVAGFQQYRRSTVQPYVEIPEKMVFNLEKGVTISGQFVDQDDKPLADQEVRIYSTERRSAAMKLYMASRHPDICRTDANGRFQCNTASSRADGIYLHLVDHGDVVSGYGLGEDGEYTLASAMDGTLKIKVDRTFMPDGKAEIEKRPVFRVNGVIFDSKGNPVPDAIVKSLLGNSDSGETTTSDTEGRFECFSPTPVIRLLVLAKDFVPAQVKIPFSGTEGVKEIEDGVVSLNEVEVQLYPGRQVAIQVVDTDGKPIAGAEVQVGYYRGVSLYGQAHEFDALPGTTNENGEFNCRSSGVVDEILRIEIRKPGYRSQMASISTFEDFKYTFTLKKNLIVSGKVIDADTTEPIKDFLTIPHDFNAGYRDYETLKRDYGRHWTDGTGRYSITFDRDAMIYYVDILAKGYAKPESRSLYRGEEEQQTLDFELKKNAWGAAKDPDKPTVLLTLVDENNHPIPHGKGRLARYPLPRGDNAESYIQDLRGFEKQATSSYDFTADADGNVEILLPKQEKLYAYRIQTTTPGYAPYDSFFDENSLTAKLQIRTSSTETIGGVVQDTDGNPIVGAEVELTVVYSVSFQNQSIPPSIVALGFLKATTNEAGQWKMGGIPTDQILYEKYIPYPKWPMWPTQSYLETARPRRFFLTHPS